MAEARPRRNDYPVGIPLRPPPGWKGKAAPPPAVPRRAFGIALKAGLVAAMVVVCMGVGWLAVGASRAHKRKARLTPSAPAPVASPAPREEPPPVAPERPKEPTPPPDAVLTYERHVMPIVERSCLSCHGKAKQRGSLDLSSYAALLRGGENGSALTPGKPDESPFLGTILAGKMPPGGKKLPERDARLIRDWIRAGARGSR